jgi:hypothetical protein
VSEKLAAFAKLYNEKAASDVEEAKANVAEYEEKLKRADELWKTVKTEADKLGITEKFLSVFPEPGGKVNITLGGSGANPNYTALFQYGDPLESFVRELSKLKNAKSRLQSSKNSLEFAESLLARKPEEHLKLLGSEIAKVAAEAASRGGEPVSEFLKLVFSSYENYSEEFIYQVDGADGPSKVNTSQEVYALLKEKIDSNSVAPKQEGSEGSSPINEPIAETATGDTGQASSNINLTEGVEPKGAENTTEGTASVTESKPEIIKTDSAPPTGTSINLNLEKAVEPSAAPEASTVSQSVINENTVSAPAPQSGPTQSEVTQQNIDLSTANTASSSTINTQNIGESVSTTGGGTMASTSVDTTINQPALEPAKEKPGFFKKAMAAAGKALSPLAERLGENSKDMLEIANYRLNQVLPINTVSKLFSKKEKETTGANQLNLTKSSPTSIDNTKTETNVAGAQTSNMSTTANQPIIETNIEKINPAVEGNPTTAAVETKTDSPTPTSPTTPTAPTLTETSPSIPTSGSSPTPAPTQPQTSSGIDVSSLEKRLKKIEIALTNPLEVIIKDH